MGMLGGERVNGGRTDGMDEKDGPSENIEHGNNDVVLEMQTANEIRLGDAKHREAAIGGGKSKFVATSDKKPFELR